MVSAPSIWARESNSASSPGRGAALVAHSLMVLPSPFNVLAMKAWHDCYEDTDLVAELKLAFVELIGALGGGRQLTVSTFAAMEPDVVRRAIADLLVVDAAPISAGGGQRPVTALERAMLIRIFEQARTACDLPTAFPEMSGKRRRREQNGEGASASGRESGRPERRSTQATDWRRILQDFYAKYNPGKVIEVENLLTKYAGQEGELYRQILDKYVNVAADTGQVESSLRTDPLDGQSLTAHELHKKWAPTYTHEDTEKYWNEKRAAELDNGGAADVGRTVDLPLPPPPPRPTTQNKPGTKRTVCMGYQGESRRDVVCWGNKCQFFCKMTTKPLLHICLGCRQPHNPPRGAACSLSRAAGVW